MMDVSGDVNEEYHHAHSTGKAILKLLDKLTKAGRIPPLGS